MKTTLWIGLVAVIVLASSAFALYDYETDARFDKSLYLSALDAYRAGAPMTAAQRAILDEYGLRPVDEPGLRRTGGPDGLGYTFIDSDEDNGPAYNWIDISATGTDFAPQMSDDSYTGPYDIGFDFTFYGSTYDQFYVQSNGTINFEDSYVGLSNYSMPYTGYNALIAWFWDDLDPNNGASGQALYETLTVDNQNALVVSFIEYDEYPDGPDAPNVTAQVILFEDGRIKMQYDDFQGAFDFDGGTIGIQSNGGMAGLEYLYNGSVPGVPYAGLAIEFEQTVDPTATIEGTVSDQAGDEVEGATVTIGAFMATTNDAGFYQMNGVFPGTFDWSVSAPGYIGSQGTVTINDGLNTVDLELTAPLSFVSGTVTEDGGSPIVGATVTVDGQSVVTGNGGAFQVGPFFPGTVDWTVTANGYYSESGQLTLVDGDNPLNVSLGDNVPQGDILVFDGDETPGSAMAIVPYLEDAGYDVYYTTEWNGDDWSAGYLAAFAFLGIYPNDYHFTTGDPEELSMIGYLNGGGKLYLEGGDIFGFIEPVDLVAMCGVEANDGTDDLDGNVDGVAGQYTEGVSMAYTGENNWIDDLTPIGGSAYTTLVNPADGMGTMVFNMTDTYATVASSFELGMLTDGADEPNTKEYLVEGILQHLDLASPSPIELNLFGTTTIIPPQGGTVVYDLQMVSTLPNIVNGLTFWTMVETPNDVMVGPIMQVPFTHTPFMNVFITGMTQPVPSFAPGGIYTFYGHCGFFGTPMYVTGDFEFEKIGAATDAIGSGEWPMGSVPSFAEVAESGEATALPTRFAMDAAYPNPFNPTTAIAVSLPEAADLSVTVHNTLGQQVAVLHDGNAPAGIATYTLDGAQLASGVYLVRASVPGRLDASQKVVLMK